MNLSITPLRQRMLDCFASATVLGGHAHVAFCGNPLILATLEGTSLKRHLHVRWIAAPDSIYCRRPPPVVRVR